MNQVFDYFLKQEIPALVLCNPNRVPIASLRASFNIEHRLRLAELSEIEFDYPESIDGGLTILSQYAQLKIKNKVFVKGFGYYTIVECPEDTEGDTPVKHVSCQSSEGDLMGRRLTGFTMTSVKLYDNNNPEGTILNLVLKYYPGWSVGYVDPDLLISPTTGNEVRREFEIDNSTLYNFLTTKVNVAYNCIFTFDTINKLVNAYYIPNLNQYSGLYFSVNNFIDKIKLTQYSDELCTCLYAFGKSDLDITQVNPLGTNSLYNFDYFLSTDWMTQELVDSITAWKAKVEAVKTSYADKATDLYQYTVDLGTLEANQINSQAELEGLEQEYSALVAAKLSTASILEDIKDKMIEVGDINYDIGMKKQQIAEAQAYLKKINGQLRFNRRSNFQKFLTDISSIYTKVKGVSKSWKSIFNIKSVDPYIVESNIQLDYDTPTIEDQFGGAISSLEALLAQGKEMLNSYPDVTEDQLNTTYRIIDTASDYLSFLVNVFDGYIPQTDISVTLNTSNILLNAYTDILGYATNFDEEQYIQLQDYIFESTYTNRNIGLNNAETIEFNEGQILSLYESASVVLDRISKPRYEISGDFVNIFGISECASAITNLDLGKLAIIEIGEGRTVEAALLEIKFTYDDPTDFEMTFSNRVKLNSSNFQFADLFSESAEKASGVSIS